MFSSVFINATILIFGILSIFTEKIGKSTKYQVKKYWFNKNIILILKQNRNLFLSGNFPTSFD